MHGCLGTSTEQMPFPLQIQSLYVYIYFSKRIIIMLMSILVSSLGRENKSCWFYFNGWKAWMLFAEAWKWNWLVPNPEILFRLGTCEELIAKVQWGQLTYLNLNPGVVQGRRFLLNLVASYSLRLWLPFFIFFLCLIIFKSVSPSWKMRLYIGKVCKMIFPFPSLRCN